MKKIKEQPPKQPSKFFTGTLRDRKLPKEKHLKVASKDVIKRFKKEDL